MITKSRIIHDYSLADFNKDKLYIYFKAYCPVYYNVIVNNFNFMYLLLHIHGKTLLANVNTNLKFSAENQT